MTNTLQERLNAMKADGKAGLTTPPSSGSDLERRLARMKADGATGKTVKPTAVKKTTQAAVKVTDPLVAAITGAAKKVQDRTADPGFAAALATAGETEDTRREGISQRTRIPEGGETAWALTQGARDALHDQAAVDQQRVAAKAELDALIRQKQTNPYIFDRADLDRRIAEASQSQASLNLQSKELGQQAEAMKYARIAAAPDFEQKASLGKWLDTRNNTISVIPSEMTDQEAKIAYYILATQGRDAVAEYTEGFMGDEINRRMGKVFSDATDKLPGVLKVPVLGLNALDSGIEQFGRGVVQAVTGEELPPSMHQYTAMYNQERLGDSAGGYLYKGVQAVGNMLPSIALSAATGGAAGVAAMGVSAGGNARAEALNAGYTPEQALLYGTVVGASEALLEKFLGGISAFGGKGVPLSDKLLDRLALWDNAILRVAATTGVHIGSEIAEEELQDVLEPAFRTAIFGEEFNMPTIEQAIETAIVTAISTGILETPRIIATDRAETSAYKRLGQEARESAPGVGEGLSDRKLGRLLSTFEHVEANPATETDLEATETTREGNSIPALEGTSTGQETALLAALRRNPNDPILRTLAELAGLNIAEQLNIDNAAIGAYNHEEGGDLDADTANASASGDSGAGRIVRAGRNRTADDFGTEGVRAFGRGSSGLSFVVLLSREATDSIRTKSGIALDLNESTDSAAFCVALDAAKAADPKNGYAVAAKSPSDLIGAKLIMAADGSTGAAVMPDGDIVAVFRNRSTGVPRSTAVTIPTAIENGGVKLDCYGPQLALLYAKFGFYPVAKVAFDPNIAKQYDGWNESMDNPGWIYFMVHNGDTADVVASKLGTYPALTVEQLSAVPVMTYDQAKNYVKDIFDPDKNRTESWLQRIGLRLPSDTTTLGSVGSVTYRDGKVNIVGTKIFEPNNPGVGPGSVGAAAAGFVGDTERGFSRNLATDEARHSEVQHEYQVNPQMYHRLANADTLQKAVDIMNTGLDNAITALDQAIGRAQSGMKLAPEMVPLSKMVGDALAQRGDMVRAEQLLSAVAVELTEAGQLGQAADILRDSSASAKRMTIEGLAKRLSEQFSTKRKPVDIKVDDALMEKYMTAESDTARDAVLDEIYQNIADQIPSTMMDKFTALRYLNMLGNLKTQVRNVGGNIIGFGMRFAKDRAAAAIERVVAVAAKATGHKFERTKAFVYNPELYAFGFKDFLNVQAEALGEHKFQDRGGVPSVIDENRTIFKSNAKNKYVRAVANAMLAPVEGLRRVTDWAMEAGDVNFSRPNYASALAQYLTAHKVTAADVKAGNVDPVLMDKARAYAIREAQRATYRDNNAVSDAISAIGFKNPKNGVQRAVNAAAQGVLPFRKTPANIMVRMVEYSPLGMVETAVRAVQRAKGVEGVTGADIVDSLAANLTGTGLFLLGMALRNAGRLVGGKDADNEEQERLNDLTGGQNYAIVGEDGSSYTVDWAAPASTSLLMGAEFSRLLEKDGWDFWTAIQAARTITNPLLETSMLSGLDDALNSSKYAENGIADVFMNALFGYMSQGLTSTLGGQVERISEDKRMTTFIDKRGTEGFFDSAPKDVQYLLGKASAKTPGWDYHQIPYIDAWGRTEETGDPLARVITNMFSPGYYSKRNATQLDTEIQRLLDAGQKGVVPDRASQSQQVNGAYMSAEQYVQYATDLGQSRLSLGLELIQSERYKRMDDDGKTDALKEVYGFSNALALKKQGQEPSDSSPYKKPLNAVENGIPLNVYCEYRDFSKTTKDSEAIQHKIYSDPRLTDEQARTLDGLVVNNVIVIKKDVTPNYSGNSEEFTISLMSDKAQRSWPTVKARLGISAEDYTKYYKAMSNVKGKKADTTQAWMDMGLTRNQTKVLWDILN